MSSMAYITLLLTLATFLNISPTISTPPHTRTPLPSSTPINGFRTKLKHIDSGKNLTRTELLHRAIERSNKRMQTLQAIHRISPSDIDITTPIHPERFEFVIDLSIGTPPSPFTAILDTGSDLTWTQCQPCKNCFHQPTPIFDPRNSSSYTPVVCRSNLCEALYTKQRVCNGDSDVCGYVYPYGGGSYTKGVMATETFTFGDDNVSVMKVGFGCGFDNGGGNGLGTLNIAGLVGLGGGPLSLVSQFQEPRFSYCLTSYFDSGETGILSMGSRATVNGSHGDRIITTPLVKNPSFPTFYYVSLNGITVGDTFLPIKVQREEKEGEFKYNDNDPRNIVVDSGTTFTHLEPSYFEQVMNEFINQTKLAVGKGNSELCFIVPPNDQGIPNNLPKLIFHFEGADGNLELPRGNYFSPDGNGLLCLTIRRSKNLPIFGNFQQQNTLVVYDLQQNTISFVPTQSCV